MEESTLTTQIKKATAHDFPELVEVWEASVQATHDFISEETIQFYKPLLQQEYLKALDVSLIRGQAGVLLGFIGIQEGKIEMLFIHPEAMGQGLGKRLLHFALTEKGAWQVDVNEQNRQAVAFYLSQGFTTVGRSAVDGMGKPYPLLHLEIEKRENA